MTAIELRLFLQVMRDQERVFGEFGEFFCHLGTFTLIIKKRNVKKIYIFRIQNHQRV